LAGLWGWSRAGGYAPAALLALGLLTPAVLALGPNPPLSEPLWHALPPFRFPRVPERLLPIASLCVAALVAFALARVRPLVAVLAIPLLFERDEGRSEEHTSELQSLTNLVCRLLLEKKK